MNGFGEVLFRPLRFFSCQGESWYPVGAALYPHRSVVVAREGLYPQKIYVTWNMGAHTGSLDSYCSLYQGTHGPLQFCKICVGAAIAPSTYSAPTKMNLLQKVVIFFLFSFK